MSTWNGSPQRELTTNPLSGKLGADQVRLGWQQAMLVLWAVISAALLIAALALTTSGHHTCARPMGTACASPSIPQHAAISGRR